MTTTSRRRPIPGQQRHEPGVMILRGFVRWLLERPDLSGSDLARRVGLSQTFISKLYRGSAISEPRPESWLRLTTARWKDWCRYLKEHPEVAQQLRNRYGWVRPAWSHHDAALPPPMPDNALDSRMIQVVEAVQRLATRVERLTVQNQVKQQRRRQVRRIK